MKMSYVDERGGVVRTITSLLFLLLMLIMATFAMLFKEQGITVLV